MKEVKLSSYSIIYFMGMVFADFVNLKGAAHKIKGSASYLCCDALREISTILQNLGHEGEILNTTTDKTPDQVAQLKANLWHNIISEYFPLYVAFLKDLKTEIANSNQ